MKTFPGSVLLSGSTPEVYRVYSGLRPVQYQFGGNLFSSFCVNLLTNQRTDTCEICFVEAKIRKLSVKNKPAVTRVSKWTLGQWPGASDYSPVHTGTVTLDYL